MTKTEFKEAVLRTMSEHDIDESNVVVDDFLNELVIGLEYDVGFEFAIINTFIGLQFKDINLTKTIKTPKGDILFLHCSPVRTYCFAGFMDLIH